MTEGPREAQLNLFGQLPVGTMTITLHFQDGEPLRQWWVEGMDPSGERILLFSDATGPSPRGGLNLAQLMSSLMELFATVRGDPSPLSPI